MEPYVTPFLEQVRSWLSWRANKRSTLAGWFTIFGMQALGGALLFLLFSFAFGSGTALPSLFFGLFFVIACGVSGVAFSTLWAILFVQIASVGFGLFFGVWLGSPSWWSAASADWSQGATIPKVIVIAGSFVPVVWCATCAPLHKQWVKAWQMSIKRILSRFATVSDDRRREAFERLKASDQEVDRALKSKDADDASLQVIPKNRVLREDPVVEEELSAEERYKKLKAGEGHSELSGLNEAAKKSRQKVDDSGAIVDVTDDSDEADDVIQVATPAAKSTVTDDKFGAKAESEPDKSIAPEKDQSPRGGASFATDNPAMLDFLADEYDRQMSVAVDEQSAIASFMSHHSSYLLSLSDRDIAYLRNLPDGRGRALAFSALQYQSSMPSISTSFLDAVEKSIEEITEEEIVRPTKNVDLSDDEKTLSVDFDVDEEDEEETFGFDTSGLAQTPTVPEFEVDFDFSGDAASRSGSGRRVASLLTMAAMPGNVQAPVTSSDLMDLSETNDGDSDKMESQASEIGVSEASVTSSSSDPAEPVAEKFDVLSRVIELCAEGLSNAEATARAHAEMEAFNKRASKINAPETGALAEPDVSKPITAEVDVATDPEKPADEQPNEEVFGDFIIGKDAISDPADQASLSEINSADVDSELPLAGKHHDGVVEQPVTDTEDAAAIDTPVSSDNSEIILEDPLEDDSHPEIADGSGSEEVSFFEGAVSVSEDNDLKGPEQHTEWNSEMIEVVVTDRQVRGIYDCVKDASLEPIEKYNVFMDLEKEEGGIDSVQAVRSTKFTSFYSDTVAHEVRNTVTSIIRDCKDRNFSIFGEIASECEAKIQELSTAPYKITAEKIQELRSRSQDLSEILKKEKPSGELDRSRFRLAHIDGKIDSLEETLRNAEAPKIKPVAVSKEASDEQRRRAELVLKSVNRGQEVNVVPADISDRNMNAGDDVFALEVAEESSSAFAEGSESVSHSMPDMPWLDPELGDLDAPFDIQPKDLDPMSEEYINAYNARWALNKRRTEARALRDEYLEREAREKAEAERIERDRIAKQVKMADLEQREEQMNERESELLRRLREFESEQNFVEQQKVYIIEQESKLGIKSKLLDEISSIFEEDASEKISALKFIHKNMNSLFQIKHVPERFAPLEAAYLDMALSKAIQMRVKVSSVGLQEAFSREDSDTLPERVFPHNSILTFHGATIFKKVSDIIKQAASLIDVKVHLPSAEGDVFDGAELIEKCENDEEKRFVTEMIKLLNASRSEFFELQGIIDLNIKDYTSSKKLESDDIDDIKALSNANANLKAEVDRLEAKSKENESNISALSAELKAAQKKIKHLTGDSDDSDKIDAIVAAVNERGYNKGGRSFSFEVENNRMVVGIHEDFLDEAAMQRWAAEASRLKSFPFVVFTDYEGHKFTSFLIDIGAIVSVQKLELENVIKYLDTVEEQQKVN